MFKRVLALSWSCLKPLTSHLVNMSLDVSDTYPTRVRHLDSSLYRCVRAPLDEEEILGEGYFCPTKIHSLLLNYCSFIDCLLNMGQI